MDITINKVSDNMNVTILSTFPVVPTELPVTPLLRNKTHFISSRPLVVSQDIENFPSYSSLDLIVNLSGKINLDATRFNQISKVACFDNIKKFVLLKSAEICELKNLIKQHRDANDDQQNKILQHLLLSMEQMCVASNYMVNVIKNANGFNNDDSVDDDDDDNGDDDNNNGDGNGDDNGDDNDYDNDIEPSKLPSSLPISKL